MDDSGPGYGNVISKSAKFDCVWLGGVPKLLIVQSLSRSLKLVRTTFSSVPVLLRFPKISFQVQLQTIHFTLARDGELESHQ
jgi:hypothetical protein